MYKFNGRGKKSRKKISDEAVKLKSLTTILNVWKWNVPLPGSYTCYFTVNASDDEVSWVRGHSQKLFRKSRQQALTSLLLGYWRWAWRSESHTNSVHLSITAAAGAALQKCWQCLIPLLSKQSIHQIRALLECGRRKGLQLFWGMSNSQKNVHLHCPPPELFLLNTKGHHKYRNNWCVVQQMKLGVSVAGLFS